MESTVVVEVAPSVNDELIEAVARLMPQLSRSAPLPTRDALQEIVAGQSTVLILARQKARIVGMVSFELAGTPEEAAALVSSLEYFALGESLGGVRALVCLPCKMTHASIPPETRAALGLSDTLIRLSPGCESAKDLVADITTGLNRLTAVPKVQEENVGV